MIARHETSMHYGPSVSFPVLEIFRRNIHIFNGFVPQFNPG